MQLIGAPGACITLPAPNPVKAGFFASWALKIFAKSLVKDKIQALVFSRELVLEIFNRVLHSTLILQVSLLVVKG